VTRARANEAELDPSAFDFVHKLLSGDLVAAPRGGFSRSAVLRFAMKVQQYSGPVMAKGLEDTAFYRFYPLASLNEVGGHPNHALQAEWKEFGEDAFVFEILDEVDQNGEKEINLKEEVKNLEEYFLEELQPFGEKGYNKLKK